MILTPAPIGALGTSVGTAEIEDGAVTTDKLDDDAVTSAKLADTAVSPGAFTATDLTVNQQGQVTAASSGASTGTGALVRAESPTLTGAPVLGAPTATTLQTTGNVGVGTTPNATVGRVLDALATGNHGTIHQVENADAASTGAFATIRAVASAAIAQIGAFGAAFNATVFGQAFASWSTMNNGSSGNGLAVGTLNAVPLILGTNGRTRVFFSGTTKTLTESSATAVVDVSLASNTVIGGTFFYTVQANDASDYQARRGSVNFVAVNKAGTIIVTAGTPVEDVAVSAGTLTATFTVTTGASKITLNLNAASSLTQTTLNAGWTIVLDGGTGNATQL